MTGALGMLALWLFAAMTKKKATGMTPIGPLPEPAQPKRATGMTPIGPLPTPTPRPGSPAALDEDAKKKAAAAAEAAKKAKAAKAAAAQPSPWPQAKPTGLPPFPSGWEPDEPPPPAVVTRAWQLLPKLWKSGQPGATVVETVKGRWITFQAQRHAGNKKGVTAYRVRGTGAQAA